MTRKLKICDTTNRQGDFMAVLVENSDAVDVVYSSDLVEVQDFFGIPDEDVIDTRK